MTGSIPSISLEICFGVKLGVVVQTFWWVLLQYTPQIPSSEFSPEFTVEFFSAQMSLGVFAKIASAVPLEIPSRVAQELFF